MAEIYKVATLNINGISAGGRMGMFNEFIRKKEIDIILLQEVTPHRFRNATRIYSAPKCRHKQARHSDINKRANITNRYNATTIRSRDGG